MVYRVYVEKKDGLRHEASGLLGELCSLLGGRAAEEIVFGVKTTGASNDIQRATSLARHMVATYGMSDELGLMAPVVVENQYLDGGIRLDCSNETYAMIDTTVKKLLQESYSESRQILSDNRALLDEIAEYLLLKETITGEELMAFVNAANAPAPEEAAEAPAEETTEE